MIMKKYILLIFVFVLGLAQNSEAQQMAFGAKGGLTIGIQKNFYPLVSYHGDLFFESMGEWKDNKGNGSLSRMGLVVQLGYHRKGVSYTNGRLYGGRPSAVAIEDVYHNISLTALLKNSYKMGVFAPYFALGFRGDATLGAELVYQNQPNFVLPQINRAMFGLWLGGGIEWEAPKMPFGLVLEISVSPDLTPQLIKTQRLVFNQSTGLYTAQFLNPPEKTINVALEVSLGFKFKIKKAAVIDEDND